MSSVSTRSRSIDKQEPPTWACELHRLLAWRSIWFGAILTRRRVNGRVFDAEKFDLQKEMPRLQKSF
jgi:hypothetical protein